MATQRGEGALMASRACIPQDPCAQEHKTSCDYGLLDWREATRAVSRMRLPGKPLTPRHLGRRLPRHVQDVRQMQCLTVGVRVDLLTAAKAIGDDQTLWWRRPYRRQEDPLTHTHRD